MGKFYGVARKEIQTASFVFTDVVDYNNLEVPLHTHDCAHFLFIVKGNYEATIKDRKQDFSSSSVIYYPAGTTHRDHFYSLDERQFLTVSLTMEANAKLPEEINVADFSINLFGPEILHLGKRIYKEMHSPDDLSPIVLDGMATELMVYSARNLDESKKLPRWLKTARELIKDCCMEPLSIAEIAATVNVHPLHLARTFRRFFKCSPSEYLRACRIEFASNLLLNSKKPLVDIALICGFSDQSQFTQSFKQSTGITPGKFRQMHDL